MRPWLRLIRRESATKVHPAASSALPISITALSKVCPWLLCIVMAIGVGGVVVGERAVDRWTPIQMLVEGPAHSLAYY